MIKAVLGTVRASAVALAAVALVSGCSSTTTGNGSSAAGGGAPAGGSGRSAGPGGTGGTGNFCHDWNTISTDLTDITAGNVREKLVGKFDTLAAEAPAAVKTDVQSIDQYIHSIVSGTPNAGKAQQFGQAFVHVGTWIAQNC